MAKYFEITLPEGLSTVKLDSSGRAKVQYTVKNVSGIRRDGRAVLVSLPAGPGVVEKNWVKIEGPTDKPFDPGQSQTYIVNIAVPPKSPTGTYSFRLEAVLVAKTDEGDSSTPVTFHVAGAASPAAKPFPWWIVAAAFLALLVLAVVLYLVLRPKPQQPAEQPPQASNSDTDRSRPPRPARSTVILGIGLDHQLYTRDNLTSPWVVVPNSGSVIGVTQIQDGKLLGIGLDNQLYTRDSLTSPWVLVPNSGAVIGITQMRGGRILGIGLDDQLYTRESLTSPWVLVPNSGSVTAVTQMHDGRILGIGLDRQLWTRESLTSPWVQVPNSGAVTGVAEMHDRRILGIGLDSQLWTRDNLTSAWVQVPNSGAVTAISKLTSAVANGG
jgi:hypothetical protein